MGYLDDLQQAHRERRARLFPVDQHIHIPIFPVQTQGVATATLGFSLGDMDDNRRKASEIIKAVLKVTEVGISDLLCPYRARHLVRARHIATFYLRRCTLLSTVQIAERLKRDHSTIIHGYQCIVANPGKYEPWISLVAKELGIVLIPKEVPFQ